MGKLSACGGTGWATSAPSCSGAEPYFYAFDLLELDGRDLRARPLLERKRRLAKIIPYDLDTRLRLLGHVPGRGRDLFRVACDHDAEGIVAKWARGTYHTDERTTSWLKIKNPNYSQAEGRHESSRVGRGVGGQPCRCGALTRE